MGIVPQPALNRPREARDDSADTGDPKNGKRELLEPYRVPEVGGTADVSRAGKEHVHKCVDLQCPHTDRSHATGARKCFNFRRDLKMEPPSPMAREAPHRPSEGNERLHER